MSEKFTRYDIEGFAQDMEVDLLTISALYSEYFSEMKSNIDDSKDFLKKEDWQMFGRRIHNMKGISSTLRIDDIYIAANDLDEKLKRGDYHNADKALMSIIEMLNSSENDIKEFFRLNNIYI